MAIVDTLDSLGEYTVAQLRDELTAGLRIYVETAWGWTEVKAPQFLRQVERRSGESAVIHAYTKIRKGGAVTLEIPRRA